MFTNYDEYMEITEDILENSEFIKLKNCLHHGLRRYDHCLRVSKISYEVSKFFHLNYRETARAALLHDFFFHQEENQKDKVITLMKHPEYALENAKKYFTLTELEEDIIVTHMFPIGKNIPKYLESWIVDIVDDGVAIYEKCYGIRKQISFAATFLFFFLTNQFK